MDGCYRRIKEVDIRPALAVLDTMQFITANPGGGADPSRYQCDVVLSSKFAPAIHALVGGLGLGGSTARAVLRRLDPRQGIPPHVDAWMPAEADWHRFQLPLITDPRIVMRWPDDGVEAHLEAGWLYEVRFDRMHEVVNGADAYRTHLQIDQVDATI